MLSEVYVELMVVMINFSSSVIYLEITLLIFILFLLVRGLAVLSECLKMCTVNESTHP
jgi:hypothetical protein